MGSSLLYTVVLALLWSPSVTEAQLRASANVTVLFDLGNSTNTTNGTNSTITREVSSSIDTAISQANVQFTLGQPFSPQPTPRPSGPPTYYYRAYPTYFPTKEAYPTLTPTARPVDIIEPTFGPTLRPVTLINPTFAPTLRPVDPIYPTRYPTRRPVDRVYPTRYPTKRPVDYMPIDDYHPTFYPTLSGVEFLGDVYPFATSVINTYTGYSTGGSIPTEIALLTNLRSLVLYVESDVVGTLPSELGSLTVLRSIRIYGASMSGTVPSSICALTEAHEDFNLEINCNDITCPTNIFCDCKCNGYS